MSGILNSVYNNMSFALYQHSEAIFKLQEQVSSGSEINRTSDDPTGAYQVLGLDSQQRSLETYMGKVDNISPILKSSADALSGIQDIIAAQQVQLVQIVNETYSPEQRATVAGGFDSALESLVSLANSKYVDQYIFGGDDSASAPYVIQRTNGEITGVTYQGSFEGLSTEVASGVTSEVLYVGDNFFRSDNRSSPEFVGGNTGAAAGTGTASITGDVWLEVTDGGGGTYDLSIDGGLSTFNTDCTSANFAVTHSQTGEVLYVDTTGITGIGTELVRAPGTCDVFNTFITIRDILKNESGFASEQVVEMASECLGSINEIESLVSDASSSIGNQQAFLDGLKHNLESMKISTEDQSNQIQEADIAQIAIDLSRQEILYQMTLSVAGRLMSLSLMDFIV